QVPSVGDAIEWGGAERVAPGKAPSFTGESKGPYVGGVGRLTSYAITSTEGDIEATSGGYWTDTAQRKVVSVPPGGKTNYTRMFVVGERPDSSSLIGELAVAFGGVTGEVEVGLGGGGTLPTGVVVTLLLDGSRERVTLAPPFVARLPVGRYWAAPMPGRSAEAPIGPIEIKAGARAHVYLPVDAPSVLDLRCTQTNFSPPRSSEAPHRIPCKFTLQGLGTTPNPNFGPTYAAGPARNQATTADGSMTVSVPAGKYLITASRGPEYSIASAEVDLAPGDRRLEALQIDRLVDTRGYLACDFHQHSILSADSSVATRDRIISNVAEGVEIAVASDHNFVADLEPIVKEMHLQGELVSIPGDELTTDASRHPWGHANVFPLPVQAATRRGGAPEVRDRTPHEVFSELRARFPTELVVQVNHPRSGKNGYFDLLGFDRARGEGTDPGYEAAFDAIEIWNGRNLDTRAKVLEDWRALLRTGHVVTAMANTDTHGIVGQEAGYPRTYVRVANDGALDSWDAARTADLVRGVKGLRDVVLTNGPMLRVSANGAPIGGIARGRAVALRVHVECAPWVDVDTLRVVRASEIAPRGEDKQSVKLVALPSGARGADVTFTVHADVDDAVFVVASGTKPLAPVLGGDEHEFVPWAMTGAIWVDADGDGRALGRAP
ncbi:MAG: CehA/McbA family metallohydrolase, partial [Myxococcota bacterium]|nr:CehA/McbA family metallohydrolase [Myxococcota bacterium]